MTGFVIYLKMAPLVWFSKHRTTVESSVFGTDIIAMKNGIETCCGLRYKLRMMGVTLGGPTYVYGDSISVFHENQHPESVLKKKLPCSTQVCCYVIINHWACALC
jgi:hypothetical protein